jgi:hypothetical protein
MRYKTIGSKTRTDGKSVMRTSILPMIKERTSDTFLIMVERMRLDHLAYKFYSNPNYWWILASANNIKGSMYVEEGTQIRIPRDLTGILHDHAKINAR